MFLEGLSGALVVARSFAVLLDGAMHIYGERLDCSINRPSQKGYGGDGVSSPQPGRGVEGHLPHRSERWVWGGSPQGSGIGARFESLFTFRCKIAVFLKSSVSSAAPRPYQRLTRSDLQSPTLAPNPFQLDVEPQVCLGMELSSFKPAGVSTVVESMFGRSPIRFAIQVIPSHDISGAWP